MTYISIHGSANFGCLIRLWFICGGIPRTSQRRIFENRSEKTHDKASIQLYKAPHVLYFGSIYYAILVSDIMEPYVSIPHIFVTSAMYCLVRIRVVGRVSVLDNVILLKYDSLQ